MVQRLACLLMVILAAWSVVCAEGERGKELQKYIFNASGRVSDPTDAKRSFSWKLRPETEAYSEEAALIAANKIVDDFLKLQYPDFKDVPQARQLKLDRVMATDAIANKVRISMHLICRGSVPWNEDPDVIIGPFEIGADERITDHFDTKVILSNEVEREIDLSLVTTGREKGSEKSLETIEIWSGSFSPGDKSKWFTVKVYEKDNPDLDRVRPAKDKDTVSDYKGYSRVGLFMVRIKHEEGKLAVEWRPTRAKLVDGGRERPSRFIKAFDLESARSTAYRAIVSVSDQAAFEAEMERFRQEDLAKDKVVRDKLKDAPPTVSVFTGAVSGKDASGSKVGTGRMVVISSDKKVAEDYVKREFPGAFNSTLICGDEAEAKKALLDLMKNAYPAASSVEVSLAPKTGRTMLDRIMDAPGRRK